MGEQLLARPMECNLCSSKVEGLRVADKCPEPGCEGRVYFVPGTPAPEVPTHVTRALALVDMALESRERLAAVGRQTGGSAPELVQGLLDRIAQLWANVPETPAPSEAAGTFEEGWMAHARIQLVGNPVIYAALYPRLVTVGREHGYAIALHGSLRKDMDVIAVPWTDEASCADELLAAVLASTEATVLGEPTDRLHGRRVWTLNLVNGSYIDFGVLVSPSGADREKRLVSFAKDMATDGCHYGDDCSPTALRRHGECYACKARRALDGEKSPDPLTLRPGREL